MLCRISRNRLYRFHYNNRQRSNPLPIGDPVGIQTQDLQNRKLIANSYYCAVGQPIGNTCNSLLNHI